MNKIKEYINWQIFLILFVNIFMASSYFTWIYLMGIIAIELMFGDSFGLLYMFLLALILIMKFLYLPILYSLLGKYSKNKIVKSFIYNLKNNKKFRIKVLVLVSIPTIILSFRQAGYDEFWSDIMAFTNTFIIQFTFIDLLGSYVVLFLWWWIRGELKSE